jgi:hypothetical protein
MDVDCPSAVQECKTDDGPDGKSLDDCNRNIPNLDKTC